MVSTESASDVRVRGRPSEPVLQYRYGIVEIVLKVVQYLAITISVIASVLYRSLHKWVRVYVLIVLEYLRPEYAYSRVTPDKKNRIFASKS